MRTEKPFTTWLTVIGSRRNIVCIIFEINSLISTTTPTRLTTRNPWSQVAIYVRFYVTRRRASFYEKTLKVVPYFSSGTNSISKITCELNQIKSGRTIRERRFHDCNPKSVRVSETYTQLTEQLMYYIIQTFLLNTSLHKIQFPLKIKGFFPIFIPERWWIN